MSVINKMLRDLDHRQAAQAPFTAGSAGSPATLRQGTSSIGQANRAASAPSRRWVWIGLAGLVAAVGAGAWVWMQAGLGATHVETASAPVPAISASSGAAVAKPVTTTTPLVVNNVTSPQEVNTAPGPVVLRMEDSLSTRRALDALLSTPGPSAPSAAVASIAAPIASSSAARERTKVAVEPAPPVAAKQAVPTIGAAPTKPAQADSTAVAQRQQQAGGDAMAQAQSLWNSGSHDAAIDLLQQSIAAAERAAKAGSAANAGALLIPLAREMARMQLAEGRFGAVWEMLTRLEPQLGNQPDLWAIRANAAQRLGRHQDSVHAYMVALQSRPDEQRWLLGTAVSLAALGQTSSASEMAEKARAVGPIGKDILAYLRQAGVVLRD